MFRYPGANQLSYFYVPGGRLAYRKAVDLTVDILMGIRSADGYHLTERIQKKQIDALYEFDQSLLG